MKGFFIRNILNRFVWPYLKGSDRYAYLKKLKKLERNPIEKNKQIQKKKLFELVRHAHNNIPYYKKIIEKNKIKYSKETIFEDIKKFPVLTKKIIRENFYDLYDSGKVKNTFKNTSGGSTGEPVIFYQDKLMDDQGAAATIMFYYWAGRREGDYMIKLWGDEREILRNAKGLDWFLIRHLKNIEIINTFKMDKKDMLNYVKIINKKKPKIIEAYVQSIYELAKFIKENNIKIHSPNGIITSAGTLHPKMKKEIEDVFNCNVLNRYGSREAGDMACSCKKDEGLHVNIFNHYFEILDKELNDVKSAEYGKVYVTTLNNYVMPLIRYDIGDIAVPKKKERCSCGRGMPLIESVKGRENEIFKTKEGKLINPGIFRQLLYFKEWVDYYQIIQKDYDLIVYRIVKNSEPMKKDLMEIEDKVKKIMGNNCKTKWEFVKKIPPLKSGKYLYVLSEVE